MSEPPGEPPSPLGGDGEAQTAGSEGTQSDSAQEAEVFAEAQRIIKSAEEDASGRPTQAWTSDDLDQADPLAPGKHHVDDSADSNIKLVSSFVNRTYFFDYFRHIAVRKFPNLSPHERVHALAQQHKRFYWTCIALDIGLKIALSSGFVYALFLVIHKSFS
ncbi:hypothetical protein [Sinomonas albida]|uniref:hypothetical protein n=1 Tax=Sinomonas albida TaxID=369942 RepID=UPI00301926EA